MKCYSILYFFFADVLLNSEALYNLNCLGHSRAHLYDLETETSHNLFVETFIHFEKNNNYFR
jgi:hypothetical protein